MKQIELKWENIQLNPKQAEFLAASQKTRCLLGGRASGKSFTIGLSILLKMIEMPGSKGGLASTNFNQLKTKTLSSVLKPWKLLGMVKGRDYVVGKPPPKHFDQPLNGPEKWDNTVTVSWGSCVELLSLVRRDGVRGGTYDYLEVDEAALVLKEDYTQALIPAVRDNKDLFTTPFHQQISFYTSIPWKPSGYWILEFEEKHKLEPHKYFWLESNANDNLHILGEDGIQRLRDEMEFLEFEVEVMNRRINAVKNPFYARFDADKHTYKPRYIEVEVGGGEYKKVAAETKRNKQINASFDFGGGINTCTVWQQDKMIERQIGEFYKKGGNTLKDLVLMICVSYKHHSCKNVKVWGEPRGHNKQPASSSWFELVQEYFEGEGWEVEQMCPRGYRTDKHETRIELINDIFEGNRSDLPTVLINDAECKNTIVVLQTTEWWNGTKDKRNEKNASFPQELATHFSDTVDYYLGFKYMTKKLRKGRRKRDMSVS